VILDISMDGVNLEKQEGADLEATITEPDLGFGQE
jgi:hypothetical protein